MKSRDGQGNERKGKDAGWQADGCPVYWFIRCFSHDVLSGHETSRRFSLCWKASYNEAHTRHTNALHIKTFTYYLFTFSYDGRQHSYFASTNRFYYSANICLFYI